MALATPFPSVRAEPAASRIPPTIGTPSLRAEAEARGLSAEQLEDLLALWGEFYWFPPRSLHELDAELAR